MASSSHAAIDRTSETGAGLGAPRFLIALVAILLLRQLWWAVFGKLNVDEFEEVQVLWLIDQGIWPWRDFLHTHLPFYNFLLYPIFAVGGPSVEIPGLVRLVFFPIILLIVFELGWLARLATGSVVAGWLSVALFLSSARIGRKLAEMRPDTIGLVLVLLGLVLFASWVRQTSPRARSLYASGLILGLSLLFTRKTVFLMPLIVVYVGMILWRIPHLEFGARARQLTSFSALVAAPMIGVMSLFVLLLSSPGFNLLLVLSGGTVSALTETLAPLKQQILSEFLSANALVLITGLLGTFEALRQQRVHPSPPGPALSLLGIWGALGVLQLFLLPVIYNHLLIFPFMGLSILAAWKLYRLRPKTLVVFLALAFIVSNLLDIAHYEGRTEQMEEARFVQENVAVGIPVLDAVSGYSIFRPIVGSLIHYRPALFEGQFQEQHDRVVEDALDRREFGAIVDILMLSHAPERIRELARQHYEPSSEHPRIWLPKASPAEGREERPW